MISKCLQAQVLQQPAMVEVLLASCEDCVQQRASLEQMYNTVLLLSNILNEPPLRVLSGSRQQQAQQQSKEANGMPAEQSPEPVCNSIAPRMVGGQLNAMTVSCVSKLGLAKPIYDS
jgi:hypothetical protein